MKKIIFASVIAGLCSGAALAQQAETVVVPTEFLGTSDSLYNLALQQPLPSFNGFVTATEMLQKHGPLLNDIDEQNLPPAGAHSITQNLTTRAFAPLGGSSFEGPGVGMPGFIMTGAPPDTTLAVGPNHVVAWVNSMYAVMNKSGGVLLVANGNALFAGAGGLCETTNRGDPILQYDRLADRWILSQFAFNVSAGNPAAPFLQCIAVSTGPNPLGTYNRYALNFGNVNFNDYGKLGIFPDAYYTSYNIFAAPSFNNIGAAMCASDRVNMLAGLPASTLCAPVTFYGGGASLLPADLDGTTLPAVTTQGNIFMRYSTAQALRILKLKPDFATNTVTITNGLGGAAGSFVNIPVGPTVRACNNFAGTCVAQPGTTNKLDTLADRLMYRLAYRNRNGLDSLMVVHSVDPDGAGTRSSTVRWYEIRSPFAAAPVLFQNANYDPGAAGDRWMGSIAMDKMGNMMIGYSVADAAAGLKPSIRVTGRLRTDVRNQMQAEQTLITGTGSQTGTLTRWGDYTTMQVDPDDCTFWYIGQYLASDGTFNWRTRINSYKFNNCVPTVVNPV